VFATPAVRDVINVSDVIVTFDHVTRRAAVARFEYVDNPTIVDLRPLTSFLKYDFQYYTTRTRQH